jgi:hypothetical protein
MTECAVDGCYDDAMDEGVLCESHEVLEYEDVWPDFHDESADWADVYADAQFDAAPESDLWDDVEAPF